VPAPRPTEPPLPERIGNFRVIGHLGQGGMATVYRAEQGALKRVVALKVVRAEFAGEPRFRESFLREAQIAASLNHPNIITCYDAGESDGQLYMAMELVGGGDLMDLLERRGGRLDEEVVLPLIHDCLAGLEATEAMGIVHRDLKPSNIFVTERGQAKIADLGLARPATDASGDGSIMGTPAYMAPEQARGQIDLDIRADLYALGATMVHLLVGMPLFIAGNAMNTLVRVVNDPLPDLRTLRPDLSPGAIAIIVHLMAKDREQRYRSATQAREDVCRVLSGGAPLHALASPAAARAAGGSTRSVRAGGEPPSGEAGRPISDATMRHSARGGADKAADPVLLANLAKRIQVSRDGLKATIALAANACFPRFLLDQIVAAAGLRCGLLDEALEEATRPSAVARHLVLARGEAPAPGTAGRTVRGEPLAALASAVKIHVAEDAMTAVAIAGQRIPVPAAELQQALHAADLRFGFEPAAMQRLCAGPLAAGERVIVARGQPARPGRAAGFHLALAAAGDGDAGAAASPEHALANLRTVAAGAVLCYWRPAEPGAPGMDVHGRMLPITEAPLRTPESFAGEGTVLRDLPQGRALLAARDGLCQQQAEGQVRVIRALEIAGDLGPGHAPIDTDQVVVVRGNVQAGAAIASTSDVVVLGNLGNAAVTAGGSLQVAGSITAGDQPIQVGGELSAAGTEGRKLLAGSVRITGDVRNCEIAASGDIVVRRVVGGAVAGGGSVTVEIAGNPDGTVTELWAGHGLSYEQHLKLARLIEARHAAERERLIGESRAIQAELEDAERNNDRMNSARFARRDVLKSHQQRLKLMADNLASLERAAEEARLRMLHDREAAAGSAPAAHAAAAGARVSVSQVAHEGVAARVADGRPETIVIPQTGYVLGAPG
jgi:serine/threonine-protein kinase